MSNTEIKDLIRKLHSVYYDNDMWKTNAGVYAFHQQLSELFNWAGITETLCENNPDEAKPEELFKRGKFQ